MWITIPIVDTDEIKLNRYIQQHDSKWNIPVHDPRLGRSSIVVLRTRSNQRLAKHLTHFFSPAIEILRRITRNWFFLTQFNLHWAGTFGGLCKIIFKTKLEECGFMSSSTDTRLELKRSSIAKIYDYFFTCFFLSAILRHMETFLLR